MAKGLFIFLEGDDDERFFRWVVGSKFRKKYPYIKIIKYASLRNKWKKIDEFIKSIKSMEADYIYVADINNSPCVTARKQEIKRRLRNIDEDRITVVIKEIESWYLAGIDDEQAKKFKIPSLRDTSSITKEQFNSLIPRKFDSRTDFMIEILKVFSVEVAKRKNKSFKYFIEKFCES